VFLAAVLFLVGIGSSFKLPGVRYALIAFGSVRGELPGGDLLPLLP
jgi:hypothetical protein